MKDINVSYILMVKCWVSTLLVSTVWRTCTKTKTHTISPLQPQIHLNFGSVHLLVLMNISFCFQTIRKPMTSSWFCRIKQSASQSLVPERWPKYNYSSTGSYRTELCFLSTCITTMTMCAMCTYVFHYTVYFVMHVMLESWNSLGLFRVK